MYIVWKLPTRHSVTLCIHIRQDLYHASAASMPSHLLKECNLHVVINYLIL